MSVKVSIVVPNYNHARFLDERMTSLLSQTFNDFELIVVDDGSTDNSREVIEKYCSDPRVQTLWFETNSGTVFQRWNDGASVAKGDYLMFANADDACAPTLLETLVRILTNTRTWGSPVHSRGKRMGQAGGSELSSKNPGGPQTLWSQA